MKAAIVESRDIAGWGMDADPDNRPAYPMRPNNEEENLDKSWERPPQQQLTVEILKSIERPDLSAVFGTSTPPRGLSGMIRRFAFRYSESSWAHWVPLLLADRINMIEGIFQDLARGHVPNIFAEMGLRAELRYRPKRFALRVGIAAIATYAVVSYFRRRRS